jgi:hypothetical protein
MLNNVTYFNIMLYKNANELRGTPDSTINSTTGWSTKTSRPRSVKPKHSNNRTLSGRPSLREHDGTWEFLVEFVLVAMFCGAFWQNSPFLSQVHPPKDISRCNECSKCAGTVPTKSDGVNSLFLFGILISPRVISVAVLGLAIIGWCRMVSHCITLYKKTHHRSPNCF